MSIGVPALALARRAAQQMGLAAEDAVIMRESASTLVELRAAGAVVRVEAPGRAFVAARMVAIARVYMASAAPIAGLIAPESQPLRYPEGAVSVWQRLEGPMAGREDYEEIGALTRELHACSLAHAGAGERSPRLAPFAELELWLDQLAADGYDAGRLAQLRAHCERLRAAWQALGGTGGERVLLHGDVHHENLIRTAQGLRFVDLEMGGWGPSCWDFAPLALSVARYGAAPELFEHFVRGYGHDPRGEAGFECAREIYALICAVWAAHCRQVSPKMAAEAELRVCTVLGAQGQRPWTLL